MENYQQHIVLDPKVRFGKPCIAGTRISVYDVLTWYASGMTSEEIIADYPELNLSQLYACMAYAAAKEDRIRVA